MRQRKGKRERCSAINETRFRNIILIFSLGALIPWALYGWDSGIDQVFDPSMYGRSFHFSTITTYGLLFFFSSRHLSGLSIDKGKNILYSVCLVALNAMTFELIYMASFQHFQLRRNLIEWFISDFYFLLQYITILFLGLWGIYAIHHDIKDKTEFKHTIGIFSVHFTLVLFFLWILYPFPVETATYGAWISNRYFPQTHYAYVHPTVYIANDILHAVNVGVKALFTISQLYMLRCFKCKTS